MTELVKRGISQKRAYTVVRSAENEDALQDQLEWGDYLIQNARSRIENPAGFHISLIENGVVPPADFETTRRHRAREETANRRAEAQQRREQLDMAYNTYRRERVAAYIETPEGKAAYDTDLEQAKKKTRKQWRKLPASLCGYGMQRCRSNATSVDLLKNPLFLTSFIPQKTLLLALLGVPLCSLHSF